MPKNVYLVLFILAMVAIIVVVDVLFLRTDFWLRLVVNIGIVLAFVALYFGVLRNL